MEVSTATFSACIAKSLIVRQLQRTSIPVLWCFWGGIQYSIQAIHFQLTPEQTLKMDAL